MSLYCLGDKMHLVPSQEEMDNLIKVNTYIKWVREEVLSWEVENFTKGVEKFGVRNLSLFCEMIGIDEKIVRVEIKKSEKDGNKSCIVSGWKISWMSIDDVRAKLKTKGIALAPRVGKLTGRARKDKKDFQPGDFELNKIIERFMVK